MHCIDIYEVSQRLISREKGLPVSNVRQLTSNHSNVATGCKIVKWFEENGLAKGTTQAEELGNVLVKSGVLRNVGGSQTGFYNDNSIYRHVRYEKPTVKDEYFGLLELVIRQLKLNSHKKSSSKKLSLTSSKSKQPSLPFWKQDTFLKELLLFHIIFLFLSFIFNYDVIGVIIIDFLAAIFTWLYLDPPTQWDKNVRRLWKNMKKILRDYEILQFLQEKILRRGGSKKLNSSGNSTGYGGIPLKKKNSEQKQKKSNDASTNGEKNISSSSATTGQSHPKRSRPRSKASESIIARRPRSSSFSTNKNTTKLSSNKKTQIINAPVSREHQGDCRNLRSYLEQKFPAENRVYSDKYLGFCLHTWTLEKAKIKLEKTLQWRAKHNIHKLHYTTLDQTILQSGSLYVYGFDKFGRPILWVRPKLKNWANISVEQEVLLHVLMIEHAVRFMPDDVHTFLLMANSDLSFKQINIGFFQSLINMFTIAYVKRLGAAIIDPDSMVVSKICQVILPLLPGTLKERIFFDKSPAKLLEVLDEEQIPTFWGGTASHDNIFQGKALDFNEMVINQANLKHKLKEKLKET